MDTSVIYCGDNLEVLPKHIPDESVDLIYIDPPFNSSRNYEVFWGEAQERRAFEDRFGDAMTYIEWMRPRIRELYRALKPTGSFYYHCDWHAGHYIKVELDRVFGFNNFQNEIVWYYSVGGKSAKRWARKHDTILFYSKSSKWYFNGEAVRDFGLRKTGRQSFGGKLGVDVDGRPYQDKKAASGKYYRYYLDKGKIPEDVWELQSIQSQSKERLGYPTQKPLLLLERIIKASSKEGDIVLDAFCGCGTSLEAAAKDKRQWIGIDFSPTACRVMSRRLEDRLGLKEGQDFQLRDMPKTSEQLRRIPHFEFENWAVLALGGIPNKVKVGDYGIDGRLYLADVTKEHRGDFFETLDRWYPIQVKQIDHVGRPDIDKFETAMRRDKRLKGYFVAFGFSGGAIKEVQRANTQDGLDIVPVTVAEILRHEGIATAV